MHFFVGRVPSSLTLAIALPIGNEFLYFLIILLTILLNYLCKQPLEYFLILSPGQISKEFEVTFKLKLSF
jgi:hypothetical protein